ncbi:MAG: hypothetical protein JKX75_00870 [Gammaproteobacteria bacterium]|nr:hypothetical protein [Gammaproteobacteria bacterium]
MKLIYLLILLFSSAAYCTPGSDGCFEEPFIEYYFARVSILDNQSIDSAGCPGSDPDTLDSPSINGARILYGIPANGIQFATNVIIEPPTNPINNNPGYFHFMEISQDNILQSLPGIESMIIDASIAYDSLNHYSLVVDYKAENRVHNSLTIQLDDNHLDFELAISWVNLGCVSSTGGICDLENGQIEVKLNYDNTEIIRTIDGLLYQKGFAGFGFSDPVYWKVSGVYWGELGNDNFNAGFELSAPSQF